MEKKKSIVLTLIGGTLMIIVSVVGSTPFYEFVIRKISHNTPEDLKALFSSIIAIMSFLAAGRGFTVIAGAILVMLNQYRMARIIISFTTGFGLSVIIICITYYIVNLTGIITSPLILTFLSQLSGLFSFYFYFGFAGTFLAVIGRRKLKNPIEMAKQTSTPEDEKASEVFILKNYKEG